MDIPKIVENPDQIANWENRRTEILHLFEEYEYSRTPEIRPDFVDLYHNEHLELTGHYVKDTYSLVFTKDNKSCGLQYEVFRKEDTPDGSPSILHINPFSTNPLGYRKEIGVDNIIGVFPNQMIADAGFIAVNCLVDRISPDDKSAYRYGIMELGQNSLGDWSAIGAWAWATSRIIDRLILDPLFDPKRIAVYGCSRGGKTALWSAASDQRIAGVFAAVSGCCGSAMHRGKTGETIREITSRFPHWSGKKFKDFIGREDLLPLDQHMLLALIAPRPLYITSASKDYWADPAKEFESCVRVSELYESLGKKGLASTVFPGVNTPIKGGRIEYHLREGDHGCTIYDWEQVLPFLKRELRRAE